MNNHDRQIAQITVRGRLDRLQLLVSWMKDWAEAEQLSDKLRYQMRLIVEEIFANAVHYGFPSGEGDIRLSLAHLEDSVKIEIRDNGLPFDPLVPVEAPEGDLDSREIGGLGLFLVQSLAKESRYLREGNWNILVITIGT